MGFTPNIGRQSSPDVSRLCDYYSDHYRNLRVDVTAAIDIQDIEGERAIFVSPIFFFFCHSENLSGAILISHF